MWNMIEMKKNHISEKKYKTEADKWKGQKKNKKWKNTMFEISYGL